MRIDPQRYVAALRDWVEQRRGQPVRARPGRGRRALDAAAAGDLARSRVLRARPAPASRRASGRARSRGFARRTGCSPTTGPTSARHGSSSTRSCRARARSTTATGSATCGRSARRTTTRRSTSSGRPIAPRTEARLRPRPPRDPAEPRARRRGSCAVRHADGARHDGGTAAGDLRAARARDRDRAAGGARSSAWSPTARCCCSTRSPHSSTSTSSATAYSLSKSGRKWLDPGSDDYVGTYIEHCYDYWGWWDRLEDIVRTGEGIEIHDFPPDHPHWETVHPRAVPAGAHQLTGGREGAAAAGAAGVAAGRRGRPRLVLGRAVPAPSRRCARRCSTCPAAPRSGGASSPSRA